MEWTQAVIAELRRLWAEGLSTAQIGRRLGVSKNAVVGKAHRLNLPARPSPIRRAGAASAPRPAVPRRIVGPTLPPLPASLAADPIRGLALPPEPRLERLGEPHASAASQISQGGEVGAPAIKPAPPRPVAARSIRAVPCCWPIGEPGTKDFHFCDAEAMPAKPYCSEHAQIAYVKVRDRREEAA